MEYTEYKKIKRCVDQIQKLLDESTIVDSQRKTIDLFMENLIETLFELCMGR